MKNEKLEMTKSIQFKAAGRVFAFGFLLSAFTFRLAFQPEACCNLFFGLYNPRSIPLLYKTVHAWRGQVVRGDLDAPG